MKNNNSKNDYARLRRKAEERVADLQEDLDVFSPLKIEEMLHELRVHQIELTMQNEALHQAQAETDAALTRYFDLYDMAPVGYCTISEKGMILEANRTVATLLGVPKNAMVQQRFSQFIFSEDQKSYYLHKIQIFKTGVLQKWDIRMVKKDGDMFWGHLEAVAAQDEGGVVCRLVINDITERIQMEEALKKAKNDAEMANTSKSQFLANMSHEIRTPMNAIIGMVKILLEMEHTPAQKKYLNIINSAGENLLTIINDILDQSKIEANKISLEYQNAILFDIFNDVQNFLYPLAFSKGIELICENVDEHFPVIKTDSVRLQQVLLNLGNNAVKFTHKGAVNINVSIEKETDTHLTLCFSVKDTGIGIPRDKLNELFKPFSQVSKVKVAGTGLGLVISKKLIELMGGNIHFESEEGKGSNFWFVISFEKGSMIQPRELIQDNHVTDIPVNLNILVAEDDIFNQEVIKGLIQNNRITVVNNGKEAVVILEDNSFDLVWIFKCLRWMELQHVKL